MNEQPTQAARRIRNTTMRKIAVWTLIASTACSTVCSTAYAIPPFPVHLPRLRPHAPTRVEMAPPNYGLYETRWKKWPGQMALLQEAAAERERRRAGKIRAIEDILPAPEDQTDQLDATPVPDLSGETDDSGLPPGLFEDAPTGPPSINGSTPLPPQDPSPAPPPVGSPIGPAGPPLGPGGATEDTEEEGDSFNLPGPSERAAQGRRRDGYVRTTSSAAGQWRSTVPRHPAPTVTVSRAQWNSAEGSRQQVAPSTHRQVERKNTPVRRATGEPRRIQLPTKVRSIDNAQAAVSHDRWASSTAIPAETPAANKRVAGHGWTAAKKP